MFYDYVDSGSWTESTYRLNQSDFEKIQFRQRIARDISNRSTKTRIIDQMVTMPVAIAPTGFAGMVHSDGEILAAQACNSFGIPYTLSTMSICSIEDVAQNSSKPFWFQLYVMKDRIFLRRLIERAKAAGCSALMLTLDLQVMGQRHKDLKNGLSAPPQLSFRNLYNLAQHPSWCLAMLRTHRHTFRNIVGHADGVSDLSSLSAWTSEQFDPTLNWDDVCRIKEQWGGKFILKGILDPEDARVAVRSGADALVVSNHGGRQLDGTCSSISALPAIIDAVQSELIQSGRRPEEVEVWMDGGVRSGQDVLRAVAQGARAVLIGRAHLYGLGAGGREGVETALNIIQKELDLTMALCGLNDISQVDRTVLLSKSG
jgi:L-lactate dehydrogenase (cytochrome)